MKPPPPTARIRCMDAPGVDRGLSRELEAAWFRDCRRFGGPSRPSESGRTEPSGTRLRSTRTGLSTCPKAAIGPYITNYSPYAFDRFVWIRDCGLAVACIASSRALWALAIHCPRCFRWNWRLASTSIAATHAGTRRSQERATRLVTRLWTPAQSGSSLPLRAVRNTSALACAAAPNHLRQRQSIREGE